MDSDNWKDGVMEDIVIGLACCLLVIILVWFGLVIMNDPYEVKQEVSTYDDPYNGLDMTIYTSVLSNEKCVWRHVETYDIPEGATVGYALIPMRVEKMRAMNFIKEKRR
jgi:hypothetical protein